MQCNETYFHHPSSILKASLNNPQKQHCISYISYVFSEYENIAEEATMINFKALKAFRSKTMKTQSL
jgi:hypothetical protein